MKKLTIPSRRPPRRTTVPTLDTPVLRAFAALVLRQALRQRQLQ
jgi:hypothetical protein